jgi:hypothetical protein
MGRGAPLERGFKWQRNCEGAGAYSRNIAADAACRRNAAMFAWSPTKFLSSDFITGDANGYLNFIVE